MGVYVDALIETHLHRSKIVVLVAGNAKSVLYEYTYVMFDFCSNNN